MATLNIVKYGDPLLRKHSRPVDAITPRILQLLDDIKQNTAKARSNINEDTTANIADELPEL